MTRLAVSCHVQRFMEWWCNDKFVLFAYIQRWAEFRCLFVGLVLETQLISAIHGVACQRIRVRHCACMCARITYLTSAVNYWGFIVSAKVRDYDSMNTGCPRRNVKYFGRVFLMLNYTDITQNTYVQSWTVTEIMAREVWKYDSCYTHTDYQIHIKTGRNMWFL